MSMSAAALHAGAACASVQPQPYAISTAYCERLPHRTSTLYLSSTDPSLPCSPACAALHARACGVRSYSHAATCHLPSASVIFRSAAAPYAWCSPLLVQTSAGTFPCTSILCFYHFLICCCPVALCSACSCAARPLPAAAHALPQPTSILHPSSADLPDLLLPCRAAAVRAAELPGPCPASRTVLRRAAHADSPHLYCASVIS
jgi:hypothetical protein